MDRLAYFGVGAFVAIMAAAAPAHAGLFDFGGRSCCDDDYCPEECCPDECGSEGYLGKKQGGLLKRFFGCFGRHKSRCGDDCCGVDCCETYCSPVGYGRAVVTDQPLAAARVAPAETAPAPPETAPAPPEGPADTVPAPSDAPAEAAAATEAPAEDAPPPPTDPSAYFPSRVRPTA